MNWMFANSQDLLSWKPNLSAVVIEMRFGKGLDHEDGALINKINTLIRALRSSSLFFCHTRSEPFGIRRGSYQNPARGHLLDLRLCSFWSYEKKNFDAKVTQYIVFLLEQPKLAKTFPIQSSPCSFCFLWLGVTTPGQFGKPLFEETELLST